DPLLSTTGLNVANANQYGGCSPGTARFSRLTASLGSVSRHSWGQPLDVSTVANCQGCVPRMDCRIVRIFRKHNFAWGGNFLTPDGMHFEWVGEPRHQLQYPSKYCANPASAQAQTEGLPPPDGRDTLFADDGLIEE
ncbi:MAG: M15 family metallopeptidase, partial [Actinomycetota bacterium]|nr:M15 family metallopeptidase [Actinomycetota bacterium]